MLKIWLFILNICVNHYFTITGSFKEQIRQASVTESLDTADYFQIRLWSKSSHEAAFSNFPSFPESFLMKPYFIMSIFAGATEWFSKMYRRG